MAWSTPKVDWDPSDGVGDTDINRIEANNLVNHRRFEVSGRAETAAVPAGTWSGMQRIYFSLDDGMSLVLKNARFRLNSAGMELRVQYDIGGGLITGWASTSHEEDSEPDTTIYSNTTGGVVTGYYYIRTYNPTGGGLTVSFLDGWSLTFEKEENGTAPAPMPTSTTTGAP